jgi:hypothetical protein
MPLTGRLPPRAFQVSRLEAAEAEALAWEALVQ